MGDVGHELTDLELAMLESEIGAVYKDASSDVGKMAQDYFEKLKIREQKMREHLDAGDITKEEYQSWWMAQIGRGEWFEQLRDKLAERMTSANEEAMRCVNDAMPSIYALNRNYAAYTIEQASNLADFNLWDEGTVRRLLRDNPETMPYYPPNRAVERGIDLAWGKQKITDTVKSGILQGLSIPQMTKYLQGTITSMNKSSATRAARTAVTSAENGGRMDTFNAASSMGIKMEKEWMATRDYRTRESHAHLDGVHVPNKKKFPNGLRYPGDPEGRAAEVYNCRCTLVSWFPELNEKRTNNTVVSYKKWVNEKNNSQYLINRHISNAKHLDADDFFSLAEGRMSDECMKVIIDTIKEYENKGGMYFSDVKFERMGCIIKENGKMSATIFETDSNNKMTVLRVNTDFFAGRTLEEINNDISNTKINLSMNLREAVIHECGHAKAYYMKSYKEIEQMNNDIQSLHIEGISEIAYNDGAECIAETEILLSRGEAVPERAFELYKKYIGEKI